MLVYQRVYHHISSHKIFTIEYDIMESWTSYGKTRWLKSSCNGSKVPFTSRGCWRRDVQPCCWFWKILGLQLQVSKRNLSGWWFQTFGKFSISYMGCHPSHWRTHIFQRGWNHQPDIETWLEGHFLLRLFSKTGHSWPRGLRTMPISLTKCHIKLGFSIYVCVCAYSIIFDGRDVFWIWQKASECSIAILKYWWVFLSSFMTPKHQEYPRVNRKFDTSIIFHLQP